MSNGTPHPRRRSTILIASLVALACLGVPAALADTAPTVTIEDPAAVTFNSAHLSGTVNPNGGPSTTAYRFEYTATPAEEGSWSPFGFGEFEGTQAEENSPLPIEAELEGLAPATEYFVRLVAENEGGANRVVSEVKSFTTDPVEPPSATFGEVTAVTASSAHFTGTVNSGGFGPGEATEYAFRCSPECPGIEGLAPVTSDGTDQAAEADATGLEPNTEYTVTLHAQNAGGESDDSEAFTTEAVGPEAETLAIHGPVADATARVVAMVDPNNSDTTYRFEYGTSTAYGQSTAAAGPVSGDSPQLVGQSLTGLQPSTTYHYRVVADNGVGGPALGSDQTVTTAATAAAGPSPCPNEAIRRQQQAQYLPDCRAYEMVSAANKNNTQVLVNSPISSDGNRVLYETLGGSASTVSGARPQLLATRTPAGWVSKDILPPPALWPAQTYLVGAVNDEVTEATMSSFEGIGSTSASPDVTLLRSPLDGTQTLLHTFPQYFGASGIEVVASEDLSRVFTNAPEAIDPSHQAGTYNVYEFGGGTPRLVSAMPATDLAPTCGVPPANSPIGFVTTAMAVSERWVSSDGSKAFFQTQGDDPDAPACDDPLQLYRRDLETGTTALVSGPVVAGDPELGVVRLLQATADGSVAVYRTATSLDAADDLDGVVADQDIYRWTEGGGNVCVTCVVPNAAVSTIGRASVSEDGAFVYFMSARQLADAPGAATNGAPNLYLVHGGVARWISRVNVSSLTPRPIEGGDLTPDGRTLIFISSRAELDALSGSGNGSLSQVYRYSSDDGGVTCLSCPAGGGVAPEAESGTLAGSRYPVQADIRTVSDDGGTVAFVTVEALVPRDVNQRPDVYVWHDGEVGLITRGRVDYPQFLGPEILTVSADGSDILIKDSDRLTGHAQDSAFKIYTARVDGGFPEPPSTPASCDGDGCLPQPSPPPAALGPGSDAFAGSGNVKQRPRRHKCKPRKGDARDHARKAGCPRHHRADRDRRAGR
jgi:hypothetical protein